MPNGSGSGLFNIDWLNADNMKGMGSILGGAGAIGDFFNGREQNSLAREQMEMMEKYAMFNANAMVDQYNTGLQLNQQGLLGRQSAGSGTYQDMDSYMSENKLDKIA